MAQRESGAVKRFMSQTRLCNWLCHADARQVFDLPKDLT
jgi:hypothetical protein